MGFIRGGALFFVGAVFLISLLVGNSLLLISSTLEYDNLQENIKPIVTEEISKEINISDIEKNFDEIKIYCEEKSSEISLIEETQDLGFEIDCDLILSSTPEDFLDKQVEKFIEENYYKEYECNFISCFKEQKIPFFLMSEQTKNYVKGKYYFLLGVSLVLAVGMFLLVENKKNFLILAGILLILSSLPFMFLKNISLGEYSQILPIFIEQAQSVFWWMLVIGLIAGGLGIGLRFWSFENIKGMFGKKGKRKKEK